MRATSDPRRTETEKWMIAALEGETFLGEMDAREKVEPTLGEFWPFMLPYYSSLQSRFSCFYSSYFEHKGERAQNILLRDGAVPLSWFFLRGAPESVAGPLLVHESLAPLVPENWRAKVRHYRHKALSEAPVENLIIVCPLTERFVSGAAVEQTLDAIEDVLGKQRMSSIKTRIFCRFPGRDHEVRIEWLKGIFSRFNNLGTLEWSAIEGSSSLRGTAYVELNGGWFYRDSYVQQRILSRGASLLLSPPSSRKAKSEFVPFSPYHGVELVDAKAPFAVDEALSRKIEDFFGQLPGNADSPSSPWPSWFEKACRAQWPEGFGLGW